MTKEERRLHLLEEVRDAASLFLRSLDVGRNVATVRRRLERRLAELEQLEGAV